MKKHDKTKTYSDSNKTSVYGDAEKLTKETVHNLKAGDNIILNNTEYKIIEIISESTGEAVIYKIQGKDKKNYGLKLYYEFNNHENEPNTEAISRIKNIKDVDILRLYDYGTGINKYKGKYCFEISDFAYGHDLLKVENLKEKYNPGFIEKELIPQIFLGILKLHENRIYHCDLKPQNVFYLDKEQTEIVIGDYGSAKTFEFDAEKKSRKTTTVKGTDFYLPPEQARGFISEKNDYYSFGMILLHLFYPEKILLNENSLSRDNGKPKSISHSKLKQIIERQFEAKPIIDYNPKYERINILIEGLTLVDFNLRWGKDQVQKWIDGKEIEVIYRASYQKFVGHKRVSEKPLKLGNYIINSPHDLSVYILNEPNWYVELIEDTKNRKDFSDWLLSLYKGDRSRRSAFNRVVKNYSPEGIDFVANAIIRFLIPEYPVTVGLQSYNLAESDDILKPTALGFFHLIFDLWENFTEKDIKLFFFNYEFALRQTKNRAEAHRVLKILYQKLSINENTENDFEEYKVLAYTIVNKNSSEAISEFLIELFIDDYEIEVISPDNENNLFYNIITSIPEYLRSIGIENKLPHNSFENQIISFRFPDSSESFDDFIEKTFKSFLEDINSKHNILKDIRLASPKKIKEAIKNIFRNIIKNIENELTSIEKEFSEEIKVIRGFSTDINAVNSYIQNIKYDKAQQTYEDILNFKSELKKVVETKEVLNQCYKAAKESSPVLPFLEEARELIETNSYKAIEKARQILTNEHSFMLETHFDIRNIKNHKEIYYKQIGKYTKIKADSYIASITMSSDGNYIVAGSNKSIMVFNAKQKKLEFTHSKIKSMLNCITISKDGKNIAYTDIYQQKAFVYDFKSGKKICSLKKTGHVAYGIAFSPDGKYLAFSGNGTLFWNVKTCEFVKIVDALVYICFHPHENLFVSINSRNQITITDLNTWESTIISDDQSYAVGRLCISADGKLIASSCKDKSVRIWDIKTSELLHTLPGHKECQDTRICFSSDGKLLVSVPKSGRIKFWNTKTGEPVLTIKKVKDISGLAFHPSGDYIVIAYDDKLILIYMKNSLAEDICNMKIPDFITYENKKSEEQTGFEPEPLNI